MPLATVRPASPSAGRTASTGARRRSASTALPQFVTEIDGEQIHFLHALAARRRAAAGDDPRLAEDLPRVRAHDRPADRSARPRRSRRGGLPRRDPVAARLRLLRPHPLHGLELRPHRARMGHADEAARLRALRRPGRRPRRAARPPARRARAGGPHRHPPDAGLRLPSGDAAEFERLDEHDEAGLAIGEEFMAKAGYHAMSSTRPNDGRLRAQRLAGRDARVAAGAADRLRRAAARPARRRRAADRRDDLLGHPHGRQRRAALLRGRPLRHRSRGGQRHP